MIPRYMTQKNVKQGLVLVKIIIGLLFGIIFVSFDICSKVYDFTSCIRVANYANYALQGSSMGALVYSSF